MKKIVLIFLFVFFTIFFFTKITLSYTGDILIYYFYIEGCPECSRVRPYLESLESKDGRLKITKLNIALPENQELRAKLDEYFNVPEDKRGVVPAIFIGEDFYIRENDIFNNIKNKIDAYSFKDSEYLLKALSSTISGKEKIKEYFQKFGVLVIFFAGLIDGINPCAFAVLIFFITFLLSQKRKKEDILITGISFTLGIFIAYLLSGVGLFRVIQKYSIVGLFSKILYAFTAILVLIFAFYSYLDYLKIKKGQGNDITLQLPGIFKKGAKNIIKKQPKSSLIFFTAFLIAFPISIIEFLCTGQTYLPTIVYIIGIPELTKRAILYLIIYNLMFILPLVIIFSGIYFGLTNRNLGEFMRRNVGKIKFATFIIFLLLGLYLLYLTLRSFGLFI
ncbi:MAG: hypothetical protein ACUVQN_03420 [Caldisericia bacterium]